MKYINALQKVRTLQNDRDRTKHSQQYYIGHLSLQAAFLKKGKISGTASTGHETSFYYTHTVGCSPLRFRRRSVKDRI